MLVGPSEIGFADIRFRTRDQRIKRSDGSSKPYIKQ